MYFPPQYCHEHDQVAGIGLQYRETIFPFIHSGISSSGSWTQRDDLCSVPSPVLCT